MTPKKKKIDTFVTQLDSDGNPIPVTAPKTLDSHPFFGIQVDEQQKIFRDSIWNPDVDIVFCNAKAGSGKTLIAVATAMLMKEYDLIDEIYYMSAAGTFEQSQGLLPGTLEEKSFVYQVPLRQALIRIGYDPDSVICSENNLMAMKNGTACVTALTDSYIRGMSIGDKDTRAFLILDETQNYKKQALRTALTRVGGKSKVVVIGEDRQCDLKYPQDSGFVPAIHLFQDKEWCRVCELTHNYRGRISATADDL